MGVLHTVPVKRQAWVHENQHEQVLDVGGFGPSDRHVPWVQYTLWLDGRHHRDQKVTVLNQVQPLTPQKSILEWRGWWKDKFALFQRSATGEEGRLMPYCLLPTDNQGI